MKSYALRKISVFAGVIAAGCAAPAPKTHTISAPSTARVSAQIDKAQAANNEARVITSRVEGKEILILNWLKARKSK